MELDRDFLQKLDVVKTTALKGVSKTTVQHFKKLECHKTDISDIEGFIVVSKKQNVWLNAFTSEEAAIECKNRYNNEFWDYQVIKCKTSREWDIFAMAMDQHGFYELARAGVDKSIEAHEKEAEND